MPSTNETPEVKALIAAVVALDTHNRSFATPPGVSLATGLADDGQWFDPTSVYWSERNDSDRRLRKDHAKGLELLGLDLSPMRETMGVESSDEAYSVGNVRFRLVNGEKFMSFLKTLDPVKDTNIMFSVIEVIQGLSAELHDGLRNGDSSEQMLELALSTPKIVEQLDRLRIPAKISAPFAKLAQPIAGGFARQRMRLETIGVLAEPGGRNFGPSNWHNDATPEYLTDRWREVMDLIRDISKHPEGRSFAKQACDGARGHLDFAIEHLKHITEQGAVEFRPENTEVYRQVDRQLTRLTSRIDAGLSTGGQALS